MGDKKTESDVVNGTTHPNTITTLIQEFEELGIKPGIVVIMHSSLSKLGWTVGGPVSVIKALMQVLTPKGTLVMFTSSGDNTEPSYWENPPVPEDWWKIIRQEMPAYHPEITPSRGMGVIVEIFRKWPDIKRSDHPNVSFAAWGKHAKFITNDHHFSTDLGEKSPLARIYDLDGQILLLGVNHSNNTSLHLAEYRSDFSGKKSTSNGAAMMLNKKKTWVVWEGLDIDSEDFEQLGKDFESINGYLPGKVGLAEARLISQRAIVDYAVQWLKENRITHN